MHKTLNKILVLFATWLISISLHPVARLNAADLELKFVGRTFSASIDRAPLRSVVRRIRSEGGIWFSGEEYLSERTVTLKFKGLPIRDGLKRILSGLNHALVFGPDNKLLGVILIANSETDRRRQREYAGRFPDQHSDTDSRRKGFAEEQEVDETMSQEEAEAKEEMARWRLARQELREQERVVEELRQEEEAEGAAREEEKID